jgi:hypothetical protein
VPGSAGNSGDQDILDNSIYIWIYFRFMSHKILITISDELKAMIDKYNQENPFEPLHISEISAKAIFEKITTLDKNIAMEKTEVMKVSKKGSNEKEVRLHDIDVEHYTAKLKHTVDTSEHSESEPSHKALIPIHEHIQKLHSEPMTETEEQVCVADFFGTECDTIEKTVEEPIYGIQTYKNKKELTLKQCEVCGKTFPAKTKRTVTCSPDCRKAKSREKGKEKTGKK